MSCCAICFEDIEVAKTGCTTLTCAHQFHYSCLTRWFISAIDADGEPSCPCCRKKMDGLENYPEYEGEEADDEDDEDEDEEDELYFSFRELKAFIRLRGGSGLAKSYWMSIRNLIALPNHVCFPSIGELNDVLTDHRANPIAAGEYDSWDEHLPHDPYRCPTSVPYHQRNIVSVHLMDDGAWTTAVCNPEEDTGVSVCLSKDEVDAAGTVAHLLAKKIQKTWKKTQPITLQALEAQLMA
jgi:hypothetical protein